VPRQRRPSQNWPWGPKLPLVQNLGGGFVVFFRGQNRNFGKVKGLKLLLNLIIIIIFDPTNFFSFSQKQKQNFSVE